ncbi:dipeptide ABC transporter ATP-binding protein [Gordonia jinghuaiqii]|uniref:ABC transporter ATP-binding protein n=1 Tax=Gordonia jinghuaiqii TaxID=2758710 RepID=A0A7D7LUS6_9ACTN|nr:ABC transporter ATP-binding protein [Gordonia jinghuaiqii]MCR5980155.1 dipeptide ABC transporter ATP-binding protein [Gordonia jinghuaiqii]QMT02081.1 ABC transporter ATP-binding protein [Gordonia jinghuaiqii]
MTADATLLSVRDLRVDFGSEAGIVDAVRGLSFDLRPGRTTAIVGESGSGKSVSAMAVLGLLPESARVSGSVTLRGRELIGLSDKEMSAIRGQDIAMVFQDPLSSLTPVYTVGAQIVEALRAHRSITSTQAWGRAVELLDLVGIGDPVRRAKAFPHELSGGMRQRVMIAMAIANDPSVIIADEPTTALDVTIQAQILDVLRTAQRETSAAMLLITHDLGVVAGSADDVVVMYAGRAVETADADTLFARPRMPYTIGLLGAVPRVDRRTDALIPIPGTPPILIDVADECQFAPRCPVAIDECRSTEPELRDAGDARRVACIRVGEIDADGTLDGRPVFEIPEPSAAAYHSDATEPAGTSGAERDDRQTVLDIANMTKVFPLTSGLLKRRVGSVRAVNDISFDIRRGEAMALVGESGSGKSTTLLEIMEFAQPAGVVRIGGVDPASVRSRQARALRQKVSIVFQDPSDALDPRFTAFDIVAEPLRALGIPKDETERRVADLMARVGLDHVHSDRFPAAFSGGQRQRLAIARALAADPELIILDEPLSALDVSVQAGIVNLIRRLQSAGDVAYLIVAHDLSVVRHLADRVAVMYLGAIVESGPTDAVFGRPAHPYTRALLSAVPVPDPRIERERRAIVLRGEQPSATEEILGCSFAGRCPLYSRLADGQQQLCRTTIPLLQPTIEERAAGADHRAACHFQEAEL